MTDFQGMAAAAANKYGIPQDVFLRQINQESAWNPRAVSHAGAQGLGQLMPATAAELGVTDPFDPYQNLDGAARYMSQKLGEFDGDVGLALAAYNAGAGNVRKYGGIPPFQETQEYVKRILGGDNYTPAPRQKAQRGPSMIQEPQKPMGILEQLGLQKRDPAAQGETALPFHQRDSFKDTAGNVAIALNSLRHRPDQALAASVHARQQERTDQADANRTIDWLTANGGGAYAEAIRNGADPAQVIIEFNNSRQPQARETVTIGDRLIDKQTGALIADYGEPEVPTSVKEYEYLIGQGVAEDVAREQAFGSGGTSVQVNTGQNETAFSKKTGELTATTTNEIVEQGGIAQRNLGSIQTLASALDSAPSGAGGALTSIASGIGIKTEGSSDLELAESIISQLVPQQRPAGSGTMSDADLALFKRSLPRLINSREGNKKIIDTMRAIAEYDVARGEIAQRRQLGQIDQTEAYQAYQALGNPLADFSAPQAESQEPLSDDDLLSKYLGAN